MRSVNWRCGFSTNCRLLEQWRGRQSGVGAAFRPKDKKHLRALSTETRRERGEHRPSSYFAASFVRLLAATTRSRRKARLDREGQPHLRLRRDGIWGFGRLDRLGRDKTLDMELGVPALRLLHTYTPLRVVSTELRIVTRGASHGGHSILNTLVSLVYTQTTVPSSMTRGQDYYCVCSKTHSLLALEPRSPSIKALEADEMEH